MLKFNFFNFNPTSLPPLSSQHHPQPLNTTLAAVAASFTHVPLPQKMWAVFGTSPLDLIDKDSETLLASQTTWMLTSPLTTQQVVSGIITTPQALRSATSLNVEYQGCFPWCLQLPSAATSLDVKRWGHFLPGADHFTLHSAMSLDMEHRGFFPHCPPLCYVECRGCLPSGCQAGWVRQISICYTICLMIHLTLDHCHVIWCWPSKILPLVSATTTTSFNVEHQGCFPGIYHHPPLCLIL